MIGSYQPMVGFHGTMRFLIILLGFFYAEFFLGMNPDYTNIHSKFYGVGKGRICNRKCALRDPSTLRPPPQISHSPRLATYKSKMEPTSQVGTTTRHNVAEGLTSAFVGVDVGLSQERARSTIWKKKKLQNK